MDRPFTPDIIDAFNGVNEYLYKVKLIQKNNIIYIAKDHNIINWIINTRKYLTNLDENISYRLGDLLDFIYLKLISNGHTVRRVSYKQLLWN